MFPIEWQEIRHADTRTNEIHIADVRTENGVVIEFQNSFLKEPEKSAREAFYKNLVKDKITNEIVTTADYSELGLLLLTVTGIALILPIGTVIIVQHSRFSTNE